MVKLKDGFRGERAFVLPQKYIREMEQNPVSAALHITDIGYYPGAAFHFRERKNPIDQFVFIYCVKGRGWYQVGNERHDVESDRYFILPAGIPHAYGASKDDPWTIYWIHFKGTLAATYTGKSRAPQELKPGLRSRIAHRIQMFEEIMTTFDHGYSMDNLLYTCTVFHHFLGTLRYLRSYRESTAEATDSKPTDVVAASIRFMKENLERPLKLAEIASHVGYSMSQYSMQFVNNIGTSPISYFNQLKITEACRLLDFTDLKINQICCMVGINDSYYFSRLFTKIMGVSPTAYRQIQKG
ncbi:MAG: AraC family transcriptional regulator [Paramuribaculum sp.]|nr:AraC family transcriptional regulator [Bacteroides sp.]MDE7461365.1 AraC family transcriptional regulator [Paramuribaculum sp.]